MPSRKRHRQSPTSLPATPVDAEAQRKVGGVVDEDVLRRFNDGLRETEQRKRDQHEQKRRQEEASTKLSEAQARLERAIAAVKRARHNGGKGGAEAEAEWKAAKAEVLFLETGERPAWAPVEAEPAEPAGEDEESAAVDEPAEDAADPEE